MSFLSIFIVLPLNVFINCDKTPWGFTASYLCKYCSLGFFSLYVNKPNNFLLRSRTSFAAEMLCDLQHFCNNNNSNTFFTLLEDQAVTICIHSPKNTPNP